MNQRTNKLIVAKNQYDLLYPIFEKEDIYKYLFELPDKHYTKLIRIFYKVHMDNLFNIYLPDVKDGNSLLILKVISYLMNEKINKHLPKETLLKKYLNCESHYLFPGILHIILFKLGKKYNPNEIMPVTELRYKYKNVCIKYHDYYLLKQGIKRQN